jgi:hypothetical protein
MNKSITNSTAFGFADDTTLLVKNNDFEDLYINAYEDLDNICDWFCANKLSINLTKTNYVLFKTKGRTKALNNIPNLIINGTEICKVDCTKFLGIMYDSKLNWINQTDTIIKKLRHTIYLFNSIKYMLPENSKLALYYAHVYPYLLYGNIIWGPMINNVSLNKISKLQDKIILSIKKSINRKNLSRYYKETKILKFKDVIELEASKFMFKIKNNLTPEPIISLFPNLNDVPRYNLRNAGIPTTTKHTSNLYNNSILAYPQRIWRQLPQIIKNSTSLIGFSRNFKKQKINDY